VICGQEAIETQARKIRGEVFTNPQRREFHLLCATTPPAAHVTPRACATHHAIHATRNRRGRTVHSTNAGRSRAIHAARTSRGIHAGKKRTSLSRELA
jgi:hypothetical protein